MQKVEHITEETSVYISETKWPTVIE